MYCWKWLKSSPAAAAPADWPTADDAEGGSPTASSTGREEEAPGTRDIGTAWSSSSALPTSPPAFPTSRALASS
eukprot:6026284-Lingulodinium_polyedra.AAC.1